MYVQNPLDTGSQLGKESLVHAWWALCKWADEHGVLGAHCAAARVRMGTKAMARVRALGWSSVGLRPYDFNEERTSSSCPCVHTTA